MTRRVVPPTLWNLTRAGTTTLDAAVGNEKQMTMLATNHRPTQANRPTPPGTTLLVR